MLVFEADAITRRDSPPQSSGDRSSSHSRRAARVARVNIDMYQKLTIPLAGLATLAGAGQKLAPSSGSGSRSGARERREQPRRALKLGAVGSDVGIDCGAFSSGVRVSAQAARSIG